MPFRHRRLYLPLVCIGRARSRPDQPRRKVTTCRVFDTACWRSALNTNGKPLRVQTPSGQLARYRSLHRAALFALLGGRVHRLVGVAFRVCRLAARSYRRLAARRHTLRHLGLLATLAILQLVNTTPPARANDGSALHPCSPIGSQGERSGAAAPFLFFMVLPVPAPLRLASRLRCSPCPLPLALRVSVSCARLSLRYRVALGWRARPRRAPKPCGLVATPFGLRARAVAGRLQH